jgi:hypothetical protein
MDGAKASGVMAGAALGCAELVPQRWHSRLGLRPAHFQTELASLLLGSLRLSGTLTGPREPIRLV